MKWFILFLSALIASAEVIPADRTITWSANVNVGVVGGIPYRTTIFTNVVTAGADNTGVTDASLVIQTNIDSCPSNEVVYIPAGTYLIQTPLTINGRWDKGITIRGDGNNTILIGDFTTESSIIDIGDDQDDIEVSAEYFAKNSTNIIVTDGSSITIGSLLRCGQRVNDPWVRSTHMFNGLQTHMCVVTGKDGNNLEVWPPSPWNFTNLFVVVEYEQNVACRIGIENLKLVPFSANSIKTIQLSSAVNCWIKGCYNDDAQREHFYIYRTVNCQISSNVFHGVTSSGPGGYGAGIHCYADNSGMLIEDNIFDETGLILMGGTSSSVVAYNYFVNLVNGWEPNQSGVFNVNHDPHNMMNLFEGNVAPQFQSDGYFGGSSHCTIFRNFFNTQHSILTNNQKAIDLCRWTYYYNAVGNVLGHPGMGGVYEMYDWAYSFTTPIIYRLGYPNMAGGSYYQTNLIDGSTLTNYPLPLLGEDGYAFVTNTVIATNVGGLGPELVGAGNELGAVSTWPISGLGTGGDNSFTFAGNSELTFTSALASNQTVLTPETYQIGFDYATDGGFFSLYVDNNQVFITENGASGSYLTNMALTSKIEFVMDSDDGEGGYRAVSMTGISIKKESLYYTGTSLSGNYTNVHNGDEIYFSTRDLSHYYSLATAAGDGTETGLEVTQSISVTNGHLCFVRSPDRWQQLDLNVTNTLLRTCNFDYVNNTNIIDPTIVDTNLVASLYLPSKPGWFGTNAYPPLDPFTPSTNWIPAQVRYWGTGIAEPPAPIGLKMKLRVP